MVWAGVAILIWISSGRSLLCLSFPYWILSHPCGWVFDLVVVWLVEPICSCRDRVLTCWAMPSGDRGSQSADKNSFYKSFGNLSEMIEKIGITLV